MVVRSEVGGACPTVSPADGVRNRAARKSDESTKDRRGYPNFEDREPRGGRVDPEAQYEPDDASDQARQRRTYRRPSQSERQCAELRANHRVDGTSTRSHARARATPRYDSAMTKASTVTVEGGLTLSYAEQGDRAGP